MNEELKIEIELKSQENLNQESQTSIPYYKKLWNNGIFLSLMGGFLFSIDNLFAKLTIKSMPAFQFSSINSILVSLIVVILGLYTKSNPFWTSFSNLKILIIIGSLFGSFLTLLYVNMEFLSLGDAITFVYGNIIITSILCWIFLNDYLHTTSICGICLCICGIIALARPTFIFDKEASYNYIGLFLGILSMITSGCFLTVVRAFKGRATSLQIILSGALFRLLISFVFAMYGWPDQITWPNSFLIYFLILCGVLFKYIAQFVIVKALALQRSSLTTSLESTQIMWGFIWGLTFLNEQFSWYSFIGSVLMIAGTWSMVLQKDEDSDDSMTIDA